jgi:hypothetical protein
LAQVKYLIGVTLHWEEGAMREGERFKEKLNPTTTAGPLSVLSMTTSSHPHHPHHSLPHHHSSSTTAGSYGSSHPSSCTFYGEDGPRNPSAGGHDNAHYYDWDQVLQSLATPTLAHHP